MTSLFLRNSSYVTISPPNDLSLPSPLPRRRVHVLSAACVRSGVEGHVLRRLLRRHHPQLAVRFHPEIVARELQRARPRRLLAIQRLSQRFLERLGVQGARYKALEFSGEAFAHLTLDDRFTVANMAVECGAKAGVFVPDAPILAYAEARKARPFHPIYPDEGASYEAVVEIDAGSLEPLVAAPPSPAAVRPAKTFADVTVDQVFIGEDGDAFDHVMLVEYPSRKAFIDMVSSSEYLVANQDSEAGPDRSLFPISNPTKPLRTSYAVFA